MYPLALEKVNIQMRGLKQGLLVEECLERVGRVIDSFIQIHLYVRIQWHWFRGFDVGN